MAKHRDTFGYKGKHRMGKNARNKNIGDNNPKTKKYLESLSNKQRKELAAKSDSELKKLGLDPMVVRSGTVGYGTGSGNRETAPAESMVENMTDPKKMK